MEVGSEFYTNSAIMGINKYNQLINTPKRFVLSGRTGLSLIAEELNLRKVFNKILLPDYCCGSMIYPFINHGFCVSFYDSFNLNNVELENNIDVVLIMDYFGFISEDTISFAQRCKEMNKTVIIDATQTAFSFSKAYVFADYLLVSYRKWLDSLCAVVYSKDGFLSAQYTSENYLYNIKWRQAAALKEDYINNGFGDKKKFLLLYGEANRSLDNSYYSFKANKKEITLIDNVDSEKLRNIRKNNAKFLINEIEKLSSIYNIQLIFNELNDEDCPLFIPVLVDENKRGDIRTSLSNDNIYCPCHWPIDTRYPFKKTPYHNKEISLICDQRYSINAMKLQINALTKALKQTSN